MPIWAIMLQAVLFVFYWPFAVITETCRASEYCYGLSPEAVAMGAILVNLAWLSILSRRKEE